MRELFVYYRVRREDVAQAGNRAAAFQADLCRRHPGLEARLLRRPAAAAEPQTWMETYAMTASPGGVSEALQSAIEAAAAAIEPWSEGPRHVEVFEPIQNQAVRLNPT